MDFLRVNIGKWGVFIVVEKRVREGGSVIVVIGVLKILKIV